MTFPGGAPVTLARVETPRGTVALRRREAAAGETGPGGVPVTELIVNGVFVMDTAETRTERLLARAALDRLPSRSSSPSPSTDPADRMRVVVAGLGLGCTLLELLDGLGDRAADVDVVELEPDVVAWVRAGLVPETAGVLTDPRVAVHVADVRRWLPHLASGTVDAVLCDVDNGPDFLVHEDNREVYESAFLTEIARVLRPGGVVALWSAARSTALADRLASVLGRCTALTERVHRQGRELAYVLYLGTVGDTSGRAR